MNSRILIVGVLLFMPLPVETAEAGASKPVAIVYALKGEALVADAFRRPLRSLDRLPAGTTLKVGSSSRLTLAFTNGRRYEMGPGSRATLGNEDLASKAGPVQSLPRFPPFPLLAPIAKDDHPGPNPGAASIRGEEIEILSPKNGSSTLAGATHLHFRPVGGATRHQVEIENARGTVIFHVVTETSTVSVPAGVLRPGARYHWTVKALDRPGPVASGTAYFITLSRKEAEVRERLRKAVEAAGDDGARALLDAVDHDLGLTSEVPEDLEEAGGAVVESVAPKSPGETVGLRAGDVILSWFCPVSPPAFPQPSSGSVRSPYDLLPLEIEEAPRRAVILRGKRGDQEMTWRLTASDWGIETRPGLPDDLNTVYLEGKAKIEAGDFAAAERSWRSAVESARSAGESRLAAWLLNRLARALAKAGKWPEADAAYEEALVALEREAEHPAAAQLLRNWGKTFDGRGLWDAAAERYQKALALYRTMAPKRSLAEARALNQLGVTAAKRGDYPGAEELLRQALAIREELAPGTAEVTGSLNNLGILARRRGDLVAAEEYLTKGEELQRRIAPESADHGLFFQNLGNLAQNRGDLERAAGFFRHALAIFEKTDPGGDGVINGLFSLSAIATKRGDLAAADDLLQRELALQERTAPTELSASGTMILLGNVAARRGDLDTAELYYRRAIAIQEKLSPDGGGDYYLGTLGILMAQRGEFATARTYLQRSLAASEKSTPESLPVVAILEQLGRLELMDSGGDLAMAEGLLRRALTILEKQAPESLETSDVLCGLGEVAIRREHLPEAIALHRRALDLRHKLAPGSASEAETLYFLGNAERRAGQSKEGTRDLYRAIDILDRQRARIGGTEEARISFEATLGDYYHACLEGLIQLGRPADAFHALERGRARSFLSLLAERDLRLSDLPAELAAERRQVDAEYDRVQSQLAHLDTSRDDAEIERLTGDLRDLQARQEEIIAKVRRESPHSAALQDPQPLDLAAARRALDPGTVLLEYAVGAEKTWIFVVQSENTGGFGLSVFPVAAGDKRLRKEVESFRRLLQRPGSDRATLQARARHLYGLLVRPAERQITAARRILISPDGPLHTLPFAVLMRGNHYLAEWKPLHSVLSATLYAELKRSRPAQRDLLAERLDAFGAPIYPRSVPDTPVDPEVRETLRRGWTLKPLPSSRKEVEAIAALYPQAHTYLGPDATEEKAKSLGADSRLVHFACHGLLDERFPLNSALALTLPEHPVEGQDNGLLQAWEIFESVRLDADLVTLSACDTALGKEMGGEGLVGLTRAFQYAGARSVLASLWGVSDVSTANFMKRFYGYLRSGKDKDEALRAAQIDQIREKSRSSHPFHWAAFELFGDWR